MTESKKNERKVASKNEDLIAEDPELAASNAAGEADAQRLRDLDSKRKDEAFRHTLEHDLNAQNGPRGAQPNTPKPPYWELREEGYQEVDQSTVDAAIALIEDDHDKIVEAGEKEQARLDAQHEKEAVKKEKEANKEDQATPNSKK